MMQHLKTFTAYTKDGEAVDLHVYIDMISVGTRDNPNEVIPGMKEIRKGDGTPVNRLEKGKYQTVDIGEEILVSDDPNAP